MNEATKKERKGSFWCCCIIVVKCVNQKGKKRELLVLLLHCPRCANQKGKGTASVTLSLSKLWLLLLHWLVVDAFGRHAKKHVTIALNVVGDLFWQVLPSATGNNSNQCSTLNTHVTNTIKHIQK